MTASEMIRAVMIVELLDRMNESLNGVFTEDDLKGGEG